MKKNYFILFLYLISFLDSEAQWIQQNSGTGYNLYDIEFINEKTGWAVGDAGVVIKTTNGGTTWMNIPNPSSQYGGLMWSIHPVDSEVVYAVAGYDFIMKTSNGGLDWDVLSGRLGSFTAFKSLYFLNRDTGWFLGTNKVFRTYDGGNTLDSFYAPWFTNSDIHFKNIDSGIFCGTGRVFKSTDRGESWFDTNVPVNGVFHFFSKLGVSENNIWVGGNRKLYKSTDFGDNWIVSDTTTGTTSISFVNENTGFIGGGTNLLWRTTDGGYNWNKQRTDPNSNSTILSFDFITDSIGWYCCGSGKIYKTITGGEVLTNVSSNSNEFSNNFNLNQNYPNPFNGETIIDFEISIADFYKFEIYNLLGKKIEEVFYNKYTPGNYSVNYNSKDLSSGIYIYRISSERFSLSKKFILLK